MKIITGDCREALRSLPDESVHCVISSPPYWGLRDYGVSGQLGMERSLGEYLDVMVGVFREVRRVLRKDGTLWLNLGDSYAASVNGRSAADTKALGNDDRTFRDKPFSTIGPVYIQDGGQVPDGKNPKARVGQSGNKGSAASDFGGRIGAGGLIKPKDLCGIPWRVAFALQEDGWWLRQDIIWAKPNPMPESVTDRCTKSHEYLFLLTKAERYYFDQEAISEPVTPSTIGRLSQPTLEQQEGSWRVPGKTNGPMKAAVPKRSGNKMRKDATERGCPSTGVAGSVPWEGLTRNKRSVWEVTTQPFSEAHFATFPPALVEPCVLAGCPVDGTVLDPFGGAGTVGLVADRLQRNAILIELNPAYVEIAERRIKGDAPLFVDVS